MRAPLTAFCLAVCLAALAGLAHAAGFIALDRDTARRLGDPAFHKKPTVVALWSADCAYCKENLKLLGEWSRREKSMTVITVAAEQELPESAALLDAKQIRGQRYVFGDDAPQALSYALDAAWHGELPRTLIFDGRGGKQAVSGLLTDAMLRKALALPGGKDK